MVYVELQKKWINNYLSNRKQYVDLENNKSSMQTIEYGVPQGSILGPPLYLIYVNDIANYTLGDILSFANETSLYLSDCNLSKLFANVNVEVNKLFNWFCANRPPPKKKKCF